MRADLDLGRNIDPGHDQPKTISLTDINNIIVNLDLKESAAAGYILTKSENVARCWERNQTEMHASDPCSSILYINIGLERCSCYRDRRFSIGT